jgi:heme-degrading monooxygenase HmoA
MFIVIVSFPPIRSGKEKEFEKWFVWSNTEFSSFKGFIRRRLLKSLEGSNYAAIVEFENRETFASVHDSPMHAKAEEQVMPLFDGKPAPHFYEVVIDN